MIHIDFNKKIFWIIAIFVILFNALLTYKMYIKEQEKASKNGSSGFKPSQQQNLDTSTPLPTNKPKPSYKVKREYDLMEGNIKKAEERAQVIQAKIAECTEGDKLKDLCDELGKVQGEVNVMYARWEELEKAFS